MVKLEYARKSVLNIEIMVANNCIEKQIHNGLYDQLIRDKHFEKENDELEESEFFMIPSISYAKDFVDKYLDLMDRILFHSEHQ